jgi:hypothetical protein
VATTTRAVIPNQVFLALPWKSALKRYEHAIEKLERTYPLHFTIVGRDEGLDAQDLLKIIMRRVESSSNRVLDANGGIADVSLGYGYTEGLEIPRGIFLSACRPSTGGPLFPDLAGKRRDRLKMEKTLLQELEQFARDHDYTKRYEKALATILENSKEQRARKSARALALKTIRALDGKAKIRRTELVQHLRADGYSESEAEQILRKLHVLGLVKCTVGEFSEAYVA